jgi:anti-sigma regulatory factor (Ser/Thr protein kinase)
MATVPPESLTSLWTYTLQLPRDPRAPRVARGMLRTALGLYGMDEVREAAELLVSEMVTNAVRHTDGPSAMRLQGAEQRLRIGVSDRSHVIPPPFDKPRNLSAPPLVPQPGESGRGLAIVQLCAVDWGGFTLGDAVFGTRGKYLWVDLAVGRRDFGFAA